MTQSQIAVTPEALRPSRVRSESATSPPDPPPEFNPPADIPLVPLATVSSGSSEIASSKPSGGHSNSAPDIHSAHSSSSLFPRRPDLRAVQKSSDDAILTSPESSSQSSVNGSPLGSDGGEHLVEMRERLLSESSDGGRRSSENVSNNGFPSDAGIDHHGPGSSPEFSAEEKRPSPEPLAGSSRSRRASTPTDKSPEHMWDSVWPATGYPLRPLVVDNLPAYNPAPVSPFVTPTFSAPASLPRRPTSPRMVPTSPKHRATSPVRISPRTATTESGQFGGQQQQQKISPTKHSRNHSSGSTMVRPTERSEPPKSPRPSMDRAHGRSRMSESFSRISSPPMAPIRSISSGRPRRTSFNDVQGLRLEEKISSEDDIPSIPPLSAPFALPPAVAEPVLGLAGDDGIVQPAVFNPSSTPTPPPAPLGRPAALRRAVSDYSTPHAAPPSQLHRTHSITTELGKPTEPPADKSMPPTSHATPVSPAHDDQHQDSAIDLTDLPTGEAGSVTIVDEGDVLPTGDLQMDITFDDEGLNALERIFLLSQSDFGFHRAYVARVVGDLLEDVDPCESVEYVLPLLSGYSMDEDDLVKEAFSAQLHKILWYFFSTCRLISEPGETVTVTSEGMSSVSGPEHDEPAIPLNIDAAHRSLVPNRESSAGPSSGSGGFSSSGLSSAGSSLTNPPSSMFDSADVTTPTSITSVSSDQTAFSPVPFVDVHAEGDTDKEPSELVVQPELLINTFTPLLGNMMLSTNPTVGENTRSAVVAVIGRLRGVVDTDKWARVQADKDERKSFVSQGGVHAHDLRPFHADAKSMVESELLSGIVLGMGHLSSELPDNYAETAIDEMPEEAEGYRIQLVQEAEAGRAISMFLIGSLCEIYSGPEASRRGFVPEVLGAVDGDETTRTEAAVALSRMAKIVPIEHVPQMVSLTPISCADCKLPVFETFVHDDIELVRQAVAIALPALVKRIESLEDRRSIAVDGLKSLYGAGDGCRCAAMEILGELIHAFYDDPLGPPVELVEIYKDDSNEEEVFAGDCDWDIIAAYNFPGVCLTLGSDRWPEIRGLFQRLQDRAGDRVLGTIASYLHELAKILTPAQVAEDLLPVYTRLIDSPEPIREKVFEHVDDFIAGLPPDLGWMTFLGLDKAWELDTLGHWRTREAVALHLPAFFTLFVKQDRDLSSVLSMTQAALLDKFAAVREAAIKSIPKSYESLNGTKFEHPFREMILSLATASAYRRRVTFTRCLREFVRPPPNREAFERFFIPSLPLLRQDVIDVRIALAQIVGDLFTVKAYYHDEPNVPESISQLVRDLAEDESCDVRDTVRHIDLDSLGKGKGPQVVKKDAEPNPLPDLAPIAEPPQYLTESPPRKDYDPEATPHATAAELLARAPDPFDSSFEREIHKDDDDTPK